MIDLDNTLNDRAGAVAEWAAAFSADRDLGPGAAEWILANDNDGYGDRRTVFVAVRDRFGLDDGLDDLIDAYRNDVRERLREVPGARTCLADLRAAGHRVVIVTNGAGEAQQHKVDELGLRELVDGVIVSGELGVAKPDPAIFEAAAGSIGQGLDGAWMVGDSAHHDIEGARRLGLRSVWIDRGRTWDPSLPSPTAVIGSLDQLAPAIAGAV